MPFSLVYYFIIRFIYVFRTYSQTDTDVIYVSIVIVSSGAAGNIVKLGVC